MNLLRLGWNLEKARFTCSRGRGWVDVLGVLGFATATVLLLMLAAAIDLFVSRAQAINLAVNPINGLDQPIPHALLNQEAVDLERMTQQFADVAFMPSTFFDAYAIVSAIAYLIMLLPALALGASCAAVATRTRACWLRTLRLIGVGRWQATLLIFIVAISQAAIGIALGGLMYFASLIGWEMLRFQGTGVTAAEVIVPPQTWLFTGALVVVVTVISTALSVRSVGLEGRFVTRPHSHPIITLKSILILVGAVGLTAYSEFSSYGINATLAASVAVGVVCLGILFVGPSLVYSLGWLMQRSRLASFVVSGAYLQANSRSAFLATVPVGAVLAVSALMAVNPQAFLTAVAASNGDLVLTDLLHSTTNLQLVRLFQRDVTVGLLLTSAGAVAVAAVANALRQATSILDHHGQDRALAMIGIPLPMLRRAYLWYQLVPLATTLLISSMIVIVFCSDTVSEAKLPFEAVGLYLAVVGFAVGIVVIANQWLAPLHKGLSEDVQALN